MLSTLRKSKNLRQMLAIMRWRGLAKMAEKDKQTLTFRFNTI